MTPLSFKFLFGLLLFYSGISFLSNAQGQKGQEKFNKRIIVDKLEDPWNIIYGPDNHLWITESKTYKILRINPQDGSQQTLLNISNEKNFKENDDHPWPQGGLMGMALHPDLLAGKPYIYLAYVYEYIGSHGENEPIEKQGIFFKTKLVRYLYDINNHTLTDSEVIIDIIPGSNDHNGGRMLIADVDGKDYLFYSVGDMGAGQYSNAARDNHAQDLSSYEGKILRFNLEPENNWIPEDNPFNETNLSAIWSLGLRNTQGLTKLEVNGRDIIYGSDHGPFSDDAINIIERAGNYGHPLVIGYADGNYDGLAAGATDRDELPGKWNTSYPLIESEKDNAEHIENYKEPLYSFYPQDNAFLTKILEKARTGGRGDWKSVAHSAIAAYNSDAIPSWHNSLLITSLKQGCIYRLKLNQEGVEVDDIKQYFPADVRYRDVAVSPDGLKIYLITDNSKVTSGPSEEHEQQLSERGAVIEMTYIP